MPARVAVLASGEGTTAEAFITACAAGELDAQVVLVIYNKPSAGVIERIERLNASLGLHVDLLHISAKTHPVIAGEDYIPGGQTQAEEQAILDALKSYDIGLVLLMGYLRRIGPKLVSEYGWRPDYVSAYQVRMLNTHAGLLPETKGLWGVHIQEHVIATGLPTGGQTLHVVAEDYDDGPVITEHRVDVAPGDDAETFFERVKTAEKAALPSDIQSFIIKRENYLKTQS